MICEIFENKGMIKETLESYEYCNELCIKDNIDNKEYLIKIADLYLHYSNYNINYEKASEIYYDVAQLYLNKEIVKFNAKKYLFKSLLCLLIIKDDIEISQKLEHYKNIDFSFSCSNECKFFEELIICKDEDEFSNVCGIFDSKITLEKWYITILLKIKNNMFSEKEIDLT